MPKIYKYNRFVFFFYSNDHLPVHVHVVCADKGNKIELRYKEEKLIRVILKKDRGKAELTEKDKKIVTKFVKKYHIGIMEKWNLFMNEKVKPKCDTINTRL